MFNINRKFRPNKKNVTVQNGKPAVRRLLDLTPVEFNVTSTPMTPLPTSVQQSVSSGTLSNREETEIIQDKLVRNSQGPSVDRGLTGPRGERGPPGNRGRIGPSGPEGRVGDTGPQGSKGVRGLMGITGDVGIQGPRGDKGHIGHTGPSGPPGPSGGEIGPAGAVGPVGEKGPAGAVGAIGEKGPAGAVGSIGKVGEKGPKGETVAMLTVNAVLNSNEPVAIVPRRDYKSILYILYAPEADVVGITIQDVVDKVPVVTNVTMALDEWATISVMSPVVTGSGPLEIIGSSQTKKTKLVMIEMTR